jgi:hypothetical protein
MIVDLQERVLPAPADTVGRLLDEILDPASSMWPAPPWFALVLDRGLEVGSRGGHGPIRYEVTGYRPGTWVRFRFHPAIGLDGYHEFAVRELPEGTELRHLIVAHPHGRMRWLWPLVVRWLHQAVLQDLFDNAERAATGRVRTPSRWSPWVRLLRRALARRAPELSRAPRADRLSGQPSDSSRSRT